MQITKSYVRIVIIVTPCLQLQLDFRRVIHHLFNFTEFNTDHIAFIKPIHNGIGIRQIFRGLSASWICNFHEATIVCLQHLDFEQQWWVKCVLYISIICECIIFEGNSLTSQWDMRWNTRVRVAQNLPRRKSFVTESSSSSSSGSHRFLRGWNLSESQDEQDEQEETDLIRESIIWIAT